VSFLISTAFEHDWCSIFIPTVDFASKSDRDEPSLTSERVTSRITRPNRQTSAQDARRPVRDVARRSALSTATCRADDDLARSAQIIFCSSCPLSDCPKAVTAKAALWHSTSGSSDLVDANTACRWIFSCVIANANSRLRQDDTGTGQQIQPIGASLGIVLLRSALQLPPLHSRSLSESLGPTRRRA